ncbi:MAG TPA: hypothetical protein VML75_15765 [Kofleriaceae bacterium]|nr:hypothetical protein [Kofleriaceae bacterium]
MPHIPDVSVVLPFGDDEDLIGTAVRRVSAHLRERGLSFEIVAVDEHSGDNSHAVLALLRPDLPELRITNAPGRGRGFASGAQRARGRTLWLIAATAAARSPLSPFGRAYRRVQRGELDLVSVERRFVVCHRTRALSAIDGLRGGATVFQRRLLKRSLGRDLAVEQQEIGGSRGRFAPSQRTLSRLLGAFASRATLW